MTHSPGSPSFYHAGDVAVTVTAREQERVRRYLAGYLAGPAETHELPAYQIALHAGAAEPTRAAAHAGALPTTRVEPVPGVVLSAASTPGGRRVFTVDKDLLENRPRSWAAAIMGSCIDLHVADPAHGPRHVLRLIRELMLRSYEDIGAVVFHAAAVEIDGGTVMICGPRGAGKTTTAAALMHQFGPRARLLSNDRVLSCDDLQVVGVPLPVPVAGGTLDAFPVLRDAVPVVQRERPGEPALDRIPLQFGTSRKIAFPARTFAAAFGSGLAAAGRLSAIVFPSLTDDDSPVSIRHAASAETHAVLSGCCFTPADEFWRPWLVPRSRDDAELAASAARRCAELAASVPCIAVSSGIGQSPARLGDALATATGAVR